MPGVLHNASTFASEKVAQIMEGSSQRAYEGVLYQAIMIGYLKGHNDAVEENGKERQ